MNLNLDIKSLIISLVALLISIDVHEFSHAWAAYLLGDDTAKRMGRMSLNPLVHLDPFGTVMMVVSSIAGFGIGWGKPVPYNPRNLRVDARTGGGVVAVAGPVSNLVLASLVALPLRLLPWESIPEIMWEILIPLAWINLSLAVFNLLPIFPLDGHRVLLASLNAVGTGWARRAADSWERLQAVGPTLLMFVIIVDNYVPILGRVLSPPATTLCGWILGPLCR
ncbi:MAG TPA: site-2 protease family protein [Anaerolineae bacterium]|jgi:Zn-dependent protease|nr:site-2 protease family protein [Anaerolineae bacterium]